MYLAVESVNTRSSNSFHSHDHFCASLKSVPGAIVQRRSFRTPVRLQLLKTDSLLAVDIIVQGNGISDKPTDPPENAFDLPIRPRTVPSGDDLPDGDSVPETL